MYAFLSCRSFLDTQYTFRLSKLKLKLRSSIMSVIYRKVKHVKSENFYCEW